MFSNQFSPRRRYESINSENNNTDRERVIANDDENRQHRSFHPIYVRRC